MKELAGLTELRLLDLSHAKISDAGLRHLAGLRRLQSLRLYDVANVTDAGLAHLKGLTDLRELNLGITSVTGEGMKANCLQTA